MGLTSRKKRPLDRMIPHLRDTRLIVIATEGKYSEKQYFESEFFRNRRIQVKVLETKDNRSAPKYVKERIRSFTKRYELNSDDQLWLVLDKDRWPDAQLADVFQHPFSNKKLIQIAVSNPCFEFWLLLHISDWGGESVSSRDVNKILKEKLGGYKKSNVKIEQFKNGVDEAILRAKLLTPLTGYRWPVNPGTNVYILVEAIFELIGKIYTQEE